MPVTEVTHEEELFSRREELFGDRRTAAKAYDYAMLVAAIHGQVDLTQAYEHAIAQANLTAGLTQTQKNAAAFPIAIDKLSKTTAIGTTEQTSQTLSEDTSQTVIDKALRQIGETMSHEISRVVMDSMASLASALETDAQAAPAQDSDV